MPANANPKQARPTKERTIGLRRNACIGDKNGKTIEQTKYPMRYDGFQQVSFVTPVCDRPKTNDMQPADKRRHYI